MKTITNDRMKEKLKAYITDNFKSKMAYARHYGVDYNNLLAIFKDKNPRPVTQAYAATIKDGNIYVREDETLIKFKVYKDEKARRGK